MNISKLIGKPFFDSRCKLAAFRWAEKEVMQHDGTEFSVAEKPNE